MIEAKKDLYKPGVVGLPLEDLPVPFYDYLKVGKRKYFVELKPNKIDISASPDSFMGLLIRELYALVEPERGELYLRLQTKSIILGQECLRDPNLYAKRFVDFALGHFQRQGIEIQHYNAAWKNDSTNGRLFHQVYKQTSDRVQAAHATWGNSVLGRHGFYVPGPEDVQFQDGGITAHFARR